MTGLKTLIHDKLILVLNSLCWAVLWVVPLDAGVTSSNWKGEIRKGEECVVLANAQLSVTVLIKGAWIISVKDREGREYVHNRKANVSSQNGIYDRMDIHGRVATNIKHRNHIMQQRFRVEDLGKGGLRMSYVNKTIKLSRTMRLHARLPILSLKSDFTHLGDEPLKTQQVLMTQINISAAPVCYNQIFLLPEGEQTHRFYMDEQGRYVKDPKDGWWAIADRESKRSVLMTLPRDGSMSMAYHYRIPYWFHLLPFSRERVYQKGDQASQSFDFAFIANASKLDELSHKDMNIEAGQLERAKGLIREELAKKAFLAGEVRELTLPEVKAENRIRSSPLGKALHRIAYLRSAFFDHPKTLTRQSFFSFTSLKAFVAEVKQAGIQFVLCNGASWNGLEREYVQLKKLLSLSGAELLFVPGHNDAKHLKTFEKVLGPSRWVRRLGDLTIIAHGVGNEDWLAGELKRAAGSRIIVVGDQIPKSLSRDTTINLSLHNTARTYHHVYFRREGKWPAVFPPLMMDYSKYNYDHHAIINVHEKHLEIDFKVVERPLGPRMFLDHKGLSPAHGVPPWIKQAPRLRVAHIGNTNVPADINGKRKRHMQRLEKFYSELQGRPYDLLIHTGSLVRESRNDNCWKHYEKLNRGISMPVWELAGRRDNPDDSPQYRKRGLFPGRLLQYNKVVKGVRFLGLDWRGKDLKTLPGESSDLCRVLVYHPSIHENRGFPDWNKKQIALLMKTRPTLMLAADTNRHLKWMEFSGSRELTTHSLTGQGGDPEWTGYFIHSFFKDRVISAFKRLGCENIYFYTDTPYRN